LASDRRLADVVDSTRSVDLPSPPRAQTSGTPWYRRAGPTGQSFKAPSGEAGKERSSAWRPPGARAATKPAGGRQIGAKNTELLTESDVARTIARIAHQIIEKTAYEPAQADQVVLLGLPTRGANGWPAGWARRSTSSPAPRQVSATWTPPSTAMTCAAARPDR